MNVSHLCVIDVWLIKSLGPIDRKFHEHGKNDGFVLYEYKIKPCSSFLRIYKHQELWKKKIKEKSMSTLNRKYVMFMGNCELVSSSSQSRSRLFLAFVFISYHKKIVYLLRYTLSLKWYRFWNCNFVKVYTFLQEIRCLKNKKVEFLQMYRT